MATLNRMTGATQLVVPSATVHFAESIPTGMDDLRGTVGVEATADALMRLVDGASTSIDLTVMYWSLLPNLTGDEQGWDMDDLETNFGADRGRALYDALGRAAGRGVKIRILDCPASNPTDQADEGALLRARVPEHVEIRSVDMNAWYGSGIMHEKIWVVDALHVYLGSANMDWKSLTQVKEIGVVVEHAPDVAAEVSRYFETWWKFAGISPADESLTVTVFDSTNQVERKVPAWSMIVGDDARIANPLDREELRTVYGLKNRQPVRFGDEDGAVVISGAPREVCVGARTHDEDLLVDTILDATSRVSISVMDFAPVSLYRGEWDTSTHRYMVDGHVASPIWWPALVNALLQVVTTRQVHARLLVSEWAHTSPFIASYLDALAATAHAAFASPSMTGGKLEIRRFRVPGWRDTGARTGTDTTAEFPGHSRVNHTKYIVTDRHINVGTSNMTWDYFYGTAGSSFNATHPSLVTKLQEIFDRDWTSDYSLPI